MSDTDTDTPSSTPSSTEPTRRPRRTQAERRAATRGALLDATIDVLVERGYAGLTTTAVCERAGVTRGAQAYYFATKGDLVIQAMSHLTDKMIAELASKPLNVADGPAEQYTVLLNRLWEIFSGRVSFALIELFNAARTDTDLRDKIRQFDRTVMKTLDEGARRVAPQLAERPEFTSAMTTAIATMRGLQMLRSVASEQSVRRAWPPARDQLLSGLRLPGSPHQVESGPNQG